MVHSVCVLIQSVSLTCAENFVEKYDGISIVWKSVIFWQIILQYQ